jgi:hypothetical protein
MHCNREERKSFNTKEREREIREKGKGEMHTTLKCTTTKRRKRNIRQKG